MPDIILSTLNAKYLHASLGLRYLYANLKELQSDSIIKEFTIQQRATDIVEQLLKEQPRIIGFGVYIWNLLETEAVVSQIKTVMPDVQIILGGPEVSYETESQSIIEYADYVITGAADHSFYHLCRELLTNNYPDKKILTSKPIDLNTLTLPYPYYSEEDIRHRLLYVEASRGCPFKCEFCLSALDKTSIPFELDLFLKNMSELYERGARHFKFVDRTFNLKIKNTIAILDFFLQRLDERLFLHFEVIPDHLPEKLQEVLVRFPKGSLQFEVGIQTFNSEVQQRISRKQNNEKSKNNLIWLKNNTQAHIHADLIFGLPGETLASFKESFNELYACHPHEIQVGILKRLKGSPIIRHTEDFGLCFNPQPPFNLLSHDHADFFTLQQMNRFARYWDMIANSGRFKFVLPQVLSQNAFNDFSQIAEWIFNQTGQTFQMNLKKLFEWLAQAIEAIFPERYPSALSALAKDYEYSKLKGDFYHLQLSADKAKIQQYPKNNRDFRHIKRQQQHLQ